MRIEPYGDRCILISEVEDPHRRRQSAIKRFPEAVVRIGIDAVLIEFDRPRADLHDLCANLPDLEAQAADASQRAHEIHVRYNGPDLESAAHLLRVDVPALIERHQATRWRVAMLGFAPGFPYLVPNDAAEWDLPRLHTPRTRVPAGSVAIAAGMSAIYPTAMPGGWHLIGSTDAVLFDPSNTPPALVQVDDVIRFRQAR